MEHSRLNSLPAELRNDIYYLALRDPDSITLNFEVAAARPKLVARNPHLLALTQTCKQICIESRPFFYSSNDFVVVIGNLARTAQFKDVSPTEYEGAIPRFLDWVEALGFANASHIRDIELHGTLNVQSTRLRPPMVAGQLLARAARFFASIGARCTLSLDITLINSVWPGYWPRQIHMNFDELSLNDLKATRLEVHTIHREYVKAWGQAVRDGCIEPHGLQCWCAMAEPCAESLGLFVRWMRKRVENVSARDWLFAQEMAMAIPKRSLKVALKMPVGWTGETNENLTEPLLGDLASEASSASESELWDE